MYAWNRIILIYPMIKYTNRVGDNWGGNGKFWHIYIIIK